MDHLSKIEMERYCLNMMEDPREIASFEEHLIRCPLCASEIELTREYIAAIRRALDWNNFIDGALREPPWPTVQ